MGYDGSMRGGGKRLRQFFNACLPTPSEEPKALLKEPPSYHIKQNNTSTLPLLDFIKM